MCRVFFSACLWVGSNRDGGTPCFPCRSGHIPCLYANSGCSRRVYCPGVNNIASRPSCQVQTHRVCPFAAIAPVAAASSTSEPVHSERSSVSACRATDPIPTHSSVTEEPVHGPVHESAVTESASLQTMQLETGCADGILPRATLLTTSEAGGSPVPNSGANMSLASVCSSMWPLPISPSPELLSGPTLSSCALSLADSTTTLHFPERACHNWPVCKGKRGRPSASGPRPRLPWCAACEKARCAGLQCQHPTCTAPPAPKEFLFFFVGRFRLFVSGCTLQ